MTLPNYITLLRIALVPFFFNYLVSYDGQSEQNRWIALAIFAVAGLSDAVDGILARVLNQQSTLGRILDPIADKLLLVSGYLGLLFVSALALQPPLWITVTIVFRDIVLIVGILVIYLVTGKFDVKPNYLGKTTTVLQMSTLIVILLQLDIASIFWSITVIATILSGFIYCRDGFRQLNEFGHHHAS